MITVDMFAMTDVGIKRDHNEDCVLITPSHGIAVLADGMGGYNAGEVASAMAVDIITEHMKDKILDRTPAQIDTATGFTGESVLLRDAIKASNDAIYQEAQTKAECAGMGTTVLAAAFYGNHITAAHVGDSRMYRLRDKKLSHVTEDHSLIHEQVQRGLLTADDARHSMFKNLVTRALGISPDAEADLVEDICQTLIRGNNNLKKISTQLIQMANDAGGPDNISIILILAKEAGKAKQGIFSRLFK